MPCLSFVCLLSRWMEEKRRNVHDSKRLTRLSGVCDGKKKCLCLELFFFLLSFVSPSKDHNRHQEGAKERRQEAKRGKGRKETESEDGMKTEKVPHHTIGIEDVCLGLAHRLDQRTVHDVVLTGPHMSRSFQLPQHYILCRRWCWPDDLLRLVHHLTGLVFLLERWVCEGRDLPAVIVEGRDVPHHWLNCVVHD